MEDEVDVLRQLFDAYRQRLRLIIIGPQSSGKSTQARLLEQRFHLKYISWGKISRLLKRSPTGLGARLLALDASDEPHPSSEVADYLLSGPIEQTELSGYGWVLDGFPRRLEEWEALERGLRERSRALTGVVVFRLSNDESKERASTRLICPECDATYSSKEDLIVCPKDGAGLVDRADDVTIEDRLKYYKEDTYPLITYLSGAGLPIIEVDASMKPKEIHEHLVEKIPRLIKEGAPRVRREGSHYRHLISTPLKTEVDRFMIHAYRHKFRGDVQLALSIGDVFGASRVPVRVHSSCITGDIFMSERCDCGQQLHKAMKVISRGSTGIIVYLFQEGRSIGIINKLRAYALQDLGADTLDANRILGLPDDARSYEAVVDILSDLGVKSIELLSNNPAKADALRNYGVNVVGTVPIECEPSEASRDYLKTKKLKMGHVLDLD